MSSFIAPIRAYDIHTYYFQSNEQSRAEAAALREKLKVDFAREIEAGVLRVYKMWDGPIGPHPYAMWECQFSTPQIFGKIVPWYQLYHGRLSVLVHPHTGNELRDHTEHAIWIGKQVPLIEDILPTDA